MLSHYFTHCSIAQAVSSSTHVENSGKVMCLRTDSATRNGQRSAKPKVPRILKELDIDDGVRILHPRSQRCLKIDNDVTLSPSMRVSSRRDEETQCPPKDKRSYAARNTEDDNDDVDQWENQDRDFSKDGFEKNEARMRRNSTIIGNAIYDMKFHPMDRTTRPNMAATRRVLAKETEGVEVSDDNERTRQSSKNAPNNTDFRRSQRSTRGQHSRKLQYSNAPSAKRVVKNPASESAVIRKKINLFKPGNGNLLMSSIGVDFDSLCSMDRILHNIQHGAPLDSISLPHSWAKVSDILMNEGFFTKDEYKAWGGAALLKQRYDVVRCVVQGEFVQSEKEDTKDQRLYWAEDMDVLDLVGSETMYKHEGIPEYMEGIERFTQNVLDQKMEEFLGSVDEATSSNMLGGESSLTRSTIADSAVPDARMATDVSLDGERAPTVQMERDTEFQGAPLRSEKSLVVEEEHKNQHGAWNTHLSATASPVSPVTHDGLSPVPRINTSGEHGELHASVTTTLESVRDPQIPKMRRKSMRRPKRPERPCEDFTIYEDSSGSTPFATEDLRGGVPDEEDSKENVKDEEDHPEATAVAETNGVSDSSSGRRDILSDQGGEIADAAPRHASETEPDLPSGNFSRAETFQQGVQRTRTPRTSSTQTSTTIA